LAIQFANILNNNETFNTCKIRILSIVKNEDRIFSKQNELKNKLDLYRVSSEFEIFTLNDIIIEYCK